MENKKVDDMKKIRLSEAFDWQIIHYLADHPEKFDVPDNYNELCDEIRHYIITRYCDVIDIKFYDFLGFELFRIEADYDMVIEVEGSCLYEEIPADGKGLF